MADGGAERYMPRDQSRRRDNPQLAGGDNLAVWPLLGLRREAFAAGGRSVERMVASVSWDEGGAACQMVLNQIFCR